MRSSSGERERETAFICYPFVFRVGNQAKPTLSLYQFNHGNNGKRGRSRLTSCSMRRIKYFTFKDTIELFFRVPCHSIPFLCTARCWLATIGAPLATNSFAWAPNKRLAEHVFAQGAHEAMEKVASTCERNPSTLSCAIVPFLCAALACMQEVRPFHVLVRQFVSTLLVRLASPSPFPPQTNA